MATHHIFDPKSNSLLDMNPNIASEDSFDPSFPHLQTISEADGDPVQPLLDLPSRTIAGADDFYGYTGQAEIDHFSTDFDISYAYPILLAGLGITPESPTNDMTNDLNFDINLGPGNDPTGTRLTLTENTDSAILNTHLSGQNPLFFDADNVLAGADLDEKLAPTPAHPSRGTSHKKHMKTKRAQSKSTTSSTLSRHRVDRFSSNRTPHHKLADESNIFGFYFGSDVSQPAGNIVQGSSSTDSSGPSIQPASHYTASWDEDGRLTYQCFTCPNVRTRKLSHMRRHLDSLCHRDPSYHCVPDCEKVFTRFDSLIRHIRTIHKDEVDNISVNDQGDAFFMESNVVTKPSPLVEGIPSGLESS